MKINPTEYDIIFDEDGLVKSSNVGCNIFLDITRRLLAQFLTESSKKGYPAISLATIISIFKNQNPSGRFLKKEPHTGKCWELCEDVFIEEIRLYITEIPLIEIGCNDKSELFLTDPDKFITTLDNFLFKLLSSWKQRIDWNELTEKILTMFKKNEYRFVVSKDSYSLFNQSNKSRLVLSDKQEEVLFRSLLSAIFFPDKRIDFIQKEISRNRTILLIRSRLRVKAGQDKFVEGSEISIKPTDLSIIKGINDELNSAEKSSTLTSSIPKEDSLNNSCGIDVIIDLGIGQKNDGYKDFANELVARFAYPYRDGSLEQRADIVEKAYRYFLEESHFIFSFLENSYPQPFNENIFKVLIEGQLCKALGIDFDETVAITNSKFENPTIEPAKKRSENEKNSDESNNAENQYLFVIKLDSSDLQKIEVESIRFNDLLHFISQKLDLIKAGSIACYEEFFEKIFEDYGGSKITPPIGLKLARGIEEESTIILLEDTNVMPNYTRRALKQLLDANIQEAIELNRRIYGLCARKRHKVHRG